LSRLDAAIKFHFGIPTKWPLHHFGTDFTMSIPTVNAFFICCGIWRATIRGSGSLPGMSLWMIGFSLGESK
jgi:hypothetical protein